MPFADLGSHAAHYRLSGTASAPRLVLANSLGSDLRIWDEVAAALAPDFAILGYDMRGHGLSGLGPQAPSIPALADDLLRLMDVVGWPSAALLGVSVGGLVAQAAALAAPTRVEALVLMDTAARIGSHESWNEAFASQGLATLRDLGIADNDARVNPNGGAIALDPTPVQDYGFMYGRSFEDPDGHIFEVMWMDLEAAGKTGSGG